MQPGLTDPGSEEGARMAGGAKELDPMIVKSEEHTYATQTSASSPKRGIVLERFFTRPGVDPLDEVEWELRSAVITGEDGRVVFEQKDVEVPRFWSQTATNVVVSKYFRGPLGTPKRETSVR